jgi:hypothetical protein
MPSITDLRLHVRHVSAFVHYLLHRGPQARQVVIAVTQRVVLDKKLARQRRVRVQ